MTDGVAEIEQRAFARAIPFVFRHDARFDLDVATDERRKFAKIDRLKRGEHFRVGDDGVLDDFGEALVELAARQSLEKIDIVDHERGMMKRAD